MSSEEDTVAIHLSPSREALEVVVDAGVDRTAAEQMLGHVQLHDQGHSHPEQTSESVRGRASFEQRMLGLMEGLSQRLGHLEAVIETTREPTRNDTPTGVPPSPSPSSVSASTSPAWADRPLDEPLDLRPIQWPDDDESETPGKLVEVSEETKTFLNSCFGKPLTNPARQCLRKTVGVPKVDATKCPKLDRVVKGSVTKETKDVDANLERIQTLVLDAVAPLVHVVECARRGQLTNDTLIANASAQIAKERCKNALKDLNNDLLTLVEDDESFENVAPMLFGDGFEKTMKEHVGAMRLEAPSAASQEILPTTPICNEFAESSLNSWSYYNIIIHVS